MITPIRGRKRTSAYLNCLSFLDKFTDDNPDKGTETDARNGMLQAWKNRLQMITPIRGRKRTLTCQAIVVSMYYVYR